MMKDGNDDFSLSSVWVRKRDQNGDGKHILQLDQMDLAIWTNTILSLGKYTDSFTWSSVWVRIEQDQR